MINRDELLDKLLNGSVWNTGVTFERTNPVPIEKYSIFGTLAEAQEYAQNNPVAYPGQTLAVITPEGLVTLYIVTADKSAPEKALTEVGSKTLGDDASITLAEDGTLSLYGFETANTGTLPQKTQDGHIQWVGIDTLTGATVGDDKSIVTEAAGEGSKGFVASIKGAATPGNADKLLSTDGAGNVTWVDQYNDTELTGKITALDAAYKAADEAIKADMALKAVKTDVDAALNLKADKTAQEATEVKATKNAEDIIAANANIKTINDDYLKAIAFDEATSKFTFTTNVAGSLVEKVVDLNLASVIKSFEYDPDTKELVLKDAEWTPEAPEGHETRVKVADLIDTYTGVDGTTVKVDVAQNQISAEVKAGTIDATKLATAVTNDIGKGVDAQTRVIAAEGKITALENAPAKAITAEQIQNWDGEVGAKAATAINASGLASLKSVVENSSTGLAATKTIADRADAASKANTEAIKGKEDAGTAKSLIDGITGVVTGMPAVDSTITTLAQVNGKVTATVEKIAIAQSQVTGLPEALAAKVAVDPNARLITNTEAQSLADLVKLKPAEAGAQVNKIEAINIDGNALEIVDKAVAIPEASQTLLGLVKLSAEFKKNEQGQLEIDGLDVKKLTQVIGEDLLLDGGCAAGQSK